MYKLFSIPTFRSAASQLCGTFPYYCLRFAFGSSMGFQIILIAELYKNDSEIAMSIDQLSWLASLAFLTPLGSIATGVLTQHLGSRSMALGTATVYIASWLLYFYSTDAITIFAGKVLGIITATNTLVAPYISEISESHFRGLSLAIAQLAVTVGAFVPLLLGSLVYWRTVALVNLVFPILVAVTVLATPNSPRWLASKGRFDEAEKALCWLRGWVQPDQVQAEFRDLVDSMQSSISTAEKHTLNWQARLRHFFHPFFQRSFYLPLGTILIIFSVYNATAMRAIHSYSAIIFQEMDSPIDASIAIVIVGALAIVGTLVILLLINRTGKRKLVFFALVVVVLCHASVAIVGFFELQDEYPWISAIAMITASSIDSLGAGTILFMLVGEVFPSHVRYIGTSITMAVSAIEGSLVNKSFLYVVDAITLPGVFLLCAFVNLVALFIYYFIFPETEGKSLQEIDAHFKSDKNTKDCEK